MLPPSQFTAFLLSSQNSDGGWGYHPASPSAVEATAWALMALEASSQSAEQRAQARDWLVKAQLADGSWPAFPGQPQGCWVTSVASHALHLQGGAPDAVRRGLAWVLNAWPAEHAFWWRLRRVFFPAREVRQNTSLCGWNWTPRTASWVEPTAHALLLLHALPADSLSPLAAKRRQMGEQLLFDRMCPGGGWNSGNPLVYGVAGLPRTGPTAWALLALKDYPERAEIQQSLDLLQAGYGKIQGPASLALAHRCLAAYARPVPPVNDALNKLYLQNRFFENILTTSWALMALTIQKGRLATED